jgi:hypothetical protein
MTTIKKAAVQPATLEKAHSNYSNLAPLVAIRQAGLMPKHGLIWLGLGHLPPKRSALSINPESLPSEDDCKFTSRWHI